MIYSPTQKDILNTIGFLCDNSSGDWIYNLQKNEMLLFSIEMDILPKLNRYEKAFVRYVKELKIAYNRTIKLISYILQEVGVDYTFIKTFREYPYVNTDVNVVIRSQDYWDVQEAFLQLGWFPLHFIQRMKERIFERGKCKLIPPSTERYAELHLYPSGTWHGMTYLTTEWIFEHSKAELFEGFEVITTDTLSDLLINYGHCIFERFRLTLGELYHNQILRKRLQGDGIIQARKVACSMGWERGFKTVDDVIDKWWQSERRNPFPIFINRADLQRSWLSRSNYHIKNFNFLKAFNFIISIKN